MNRKVVVGIILVVIASAGAYLFLKRAHSQPSVTATLRITVTPGEQMDYVVSQANSAMFKYMISKDAAVSPALARKLEIKKVPNSSLLEAKVMVMSREDGQRFAKTFVDTLQIHCGKQVQLTLAEQSVQ